MKSKSIQDKNCLVDHKGRECTCDFSFVEQSKEEQCRCGCHNEDSYWHGQDCYCKPKTEDTGECIFCKATPHDLSCPNNPNKNVPAPLNKDWSEYTPELFRDYLYVDLNLKSKEILEIMIRARVLIESARASERARIIEIIQKHKYQKDIKSKLKSQNPLKEILRNKSQQTRIQVVNDILDELLSKIEEKE